ncbi:alkaline phosphatase/alkaline phosphatase D [Prosthecobacter fusiformis]|uniref:Alkaline phosphatase/alkaline phosphatase D n=1 Tax=Prosthecobacter fusiformis TaxID=48464 RepID=A0A4R7SNL9_9BACT|nr:alkaline phosphatase D family protein [Prosthecobacter fusiformis]TDU80770.1 alkaline phosphatase/alkaline phosphatase D [Prosthecobacter fusiformis]
MKLNFALFCLISLSSLVRADVFMAQGCMSGEVTDSTVLLQTRLTAIAGPELNEKGDVPGIRGVACFEYGVKPDFSDASRTEWMSATEESDFIVRAQLLGLKSGELYYFRAVVGDDEKGAKSGPACEFRTLPGGDSARAVTFAIGSCMNYHKFMEGKKVKTGAVISASEEDKRLGYPSFKVLVSLKPDFFIGTGDIVYYDNIMNGPARTLPQLRECWHEQFRFPRLVDFFACTPAYWSKDDHDFRFNDGDNSGDRMPMPQTGIEVFREQMPIHAAGDRTSPTYRTHRVSKHLQIWLTEGRDHRSPNKMEDGPDKSLWGKEQREWLQRTLKESDATWKLLISPTPMVGPDDAYKTDNHANLGGFRHEADAFFAWLKEESITGFMTFCGDRHWQYHSIHPSGFEEFACGALNDENSRIGVEPGSKKGTDPEALIKQPYTYPKATGGFILVKSGHDGGDGAKLEIIHYDDTGKVMNTVTKVQ